MRPERKQDVRHGIILLLAMLLLLTMSFVAEAHNEPSIVVPLKAERYKRDLIRNARFYWGFDAPIAAFAAQIHQESHWREEAKSHVGATGLAQFMPSTADWISGVYRQDLGENQPLNPIWALRAMLVYDRHLWDRVSGTTLCDRMAFVLSAYNGGLGWVYRDKKKAKEMGLDDQKWFGHVETVNAGRAPWAVKENKDYPKRILIRIQPSYLLWGDGIGCA
jgi:soluble lytic murein transglycosylase-like protein